MATPEDIKRVLLVQGGLIYPTSKEADKYHFIQMPPMHLNHTDWLLLLPNRKVIFGWSSCIVHTRILVFYDVSTICLHQMLIFEPFHTNATDALKPHGLIVALAKQKGYFLVGPQSTPINIVPNKGSTYHCYLKCWKHQQWILHTLDRLTAKSEQRSIFYQSTYYLQHWRTGSMTIGLSSVTNLVVTKGFLMKRPQRYIFVTNIGSLRSVQGVTWFSPVMVP